VGTSPYAGNGVRLRPLGNVGRVTNYDLLGVSAADRVEIDRLVVDAGAVGEAADLLRKRIGTFPVGIDRVADDEFVAIAAFLDTLDEALALHADLGIPAAVTRATFADFGRVLDLNRAVHGRFGADVHRWLGWHWAGSLYQLGRLQYALRRLDTTPGTPDANVPGEWVLDLHIPDAGPFPPDAVDASLAAARQFFPRYLPDKPVRTVICASWLLDPYLAEHLPDGANITRFARRFTPYAEPRDMPGDAVYFTFRTRDMKHLDRLPRDTTLQRVVLDRIAAGGTWQIGYGFFPP
jgi:GNAT-like C-terminal domain/N-acyltransferase N-terminal domain